MSSGTAPDPRLTRGAPNARGPSRGASGRAPWHGGWPQAQRGHEPRGGALFLCVGFGKGPEPEGGRGRAFSNQAPTTHSTPNELLTPTQDKSQQSGQVRTREPGPTWGKLQKSPTVLPGPLALGQAQNFSRFPLLDSLGLRNNKQTKTAVLLKALTSW